MSELTAAPVCDVGGEEWINRTQRRAGAGNIVDFIILAEFDIDTGSTVRHQYPHPIPGHETDHFAEYMLPEGAHNREEDWTYMILNRNATQVEEALWLTSPEDSAGSATCDDAAAETEAGHLLYGINHVRTKYDSTVRRGAIVKAIAFFSKYHFVESFKDVLVEALEMYYENPSVNVLAAVYSRLSEIRLDQYPVLNPTEQFFLKKRCLRNTLCAIELGETRPLPPPGMIPAAEIAVALPPPATEVGSPPQARSAFISIPLDRSQDEMGDINLTRLLKLFGESSMRIYNAILARQRVLFVGYNHAACDLAQMVFSAVAMCAPPLVGVIKRAVPYATLSDLSFLEIPGYVAGVTNPMFQQHDNWFDLLCILDVPNEKGTVKSAEEHRADEAQQKGKAHPTQPPNPAEVAIDNLDSKFIARVLSGAQANFGEQWIRLQFYEYTMGFVQEAMDLKFNRGLQGFEKFPEKYQKKYDVRYLRIAKVASSDEFRLAPRHPWCWLTESENPYPIDGNRVRRDIRKLTVEVDLPGDIVQSTFEYIDHTMVSEKALQALLCALSHSAGGLTTLSIALFHPYKSVRDRVLSIFRKLKSFESTAYVFEDLNPFYVIALQESTVGGGGGESEFYTADDKKGSN